MRSNYRGRQRWRTQDEPAGNVGRDLHRDARQSEMRSVRSDEPLRRRVAVHQGTDPKARDYSVLTSPTPDRSRRKNSLFSRARAHEDYRIVESCGTSSCAKLLPPQIRRMGRSGPGVSGGIQNSRYPGAFSRSPNGPTRSVDGFHQVPARPAESGERARRDYWEANIPSKNTGRFPRGVESPAFRAVG